MHDEMAVRVGDGIQQLLEQRHPSRSVELLRIGEARQRLAFDVLHRHPGSAVIQFTAVDELGDMRMAESCQQGAFAAQARGDAVVVTQATQQLDRDLLLEIAVLALAKEDRAHAALAKSPQQAEWADPFGHLFGVAKTATSGCHRAGQWIGGRSCVRVRSCVLRQHRQQAPSKRIVIAAGLFDEVRALFLGLLQRLVKQRVEAFEVDAAHGAPSSSSASSQARPLRRSRFTVASEMASASAISA